MDPEFRSFIGDNALSIDLINIAPLDDLHQPMGVIEEAQKLAADALARIIRSSPYKGQAAPL